jgi:hypothetical protein
VESGVSGLSRTREWDVIVPLTLPDLGERHPAEIEFVALGDGVFRHEGRVAPALLERLSAEVERELEPPFAARAVRRTEDEWIVAARMLNNADLLSLPEAVQADSLEVAVSPDGEEVVLVDGEALARPADAATADALAELGRRGRDRFQAFVARADKVDDEHWQLTIDPL